MATMVSAMAAMVLCLAISSARAAVTVGAFAADELVTRLRSSVFVETAFLEEPEGLHVEKH